MSQLCSDLDSANFQIILDQEISAGFDDVRKFEIRINVFPDNKQLTFHCSVTKSVGYGVNDAKLKDVFKSKIKSYVLKCRKNNTQLEEIHIIGLTSSDF